MCLSDKGPDRSIYHKQHVEIGFCHLDNAYRQMVTGAKGYCLYALDTLTIEASGLVSGFGNDKSSESLGRDGL